MISLQRVSKHYPPDQYAVKDIDLTLAQGEFLFIAGASGAGKSTLLKMLYGAEQATHGSVVVLGRDLRKVSSEDRALMRRETGIIFQDYKLLPRRTLLDNVAFGLEIQGYALKERRKLAWHLLKTIGLSDRADSLPETLSGGEQQRVAVARALIHRPKLILADEPTGNLDRQMTWIIFDLLLEAHSLGASVVVATHDLAIIEELNLRTIVLDKGKIIGNFSTLQRLE